MEDEKKNSIRGVIKLFLGGEILLRMKIHRLFPYILFAFVLGWVNIWLNYNIERTMAQAEKNRKELETLKIYHAQKTCEYVSFDRISTIETMLEEKGSEVQAPEKPADILKN